MWDSRRPHFLVGFDPSLCSERLRIPYHFIKHMEGRAPDTAVIVGPSGNSWFVDLVLAEGGLFFSNEWVVLVKDHFLEQGDVLVFRYDGDLQFSMQIFDRSMCEKETAFSAMNSQDLSKYNTHILKKRDREVSNLLDSIAEAVPKKLRSSQMHCGAPCKDYMDGTNVLSEQQWAQEADGLCLLKNAVTVAVPLTVVPNDNSDPSVKNRNSNLDMLLSASEAERIAESFSSSFPNFTKVMKRFNISGSYTLNIPYQFATEHFPNCKVKIILRNLKGESWTVNSIPTTKVKMSHTFCGGWLSFVRDNNIGIGDICIFELLQRYELQVRILRVGKEGLDLDCEAGQTGRNNGRPSTSNKISRRKSKKTSEVSYNNKGAFICSQSNNSAVTSAVHKRFGSLTKPGSHTKGCMSLKCAPEEKMAAEYFVSSYPHFVRVMKKFNVSGSFTLKIPYQFSMEHLPNCRTEIVLRNLNGQCWTVNSVPTVKVQTLHTFCGGWMAFVRENDLQMGDICIFELVGHCEMRVHICGIGKKGLNYLNGTKNLTLQ